MKYRQLGRSALHVAPLAFGGNVFGWTADESTSFALLDAFVAAGGNLIDTADTYSRWVPGHRGGESETIIGRWLKKSGKRDQVIIATKVGMEMGAGRKGLSAAHIARSVEDSLTRMQTDRIDLYQSHTDDDEVPLEETLGAYGKLIKAGKVRYIGASNYSAARLDEALAVSARGGLPRYESLQPLYNLYDRADFEKERAGVCARREIGVISYFSLASGFLSGKYRSVADLGRSPRGARVTSYLDARGMRILDALERVAAEYSATPARIAIAWLIAQATITAPIASATSLAQLAELTAAAVLELSPAALAELDSASAYA